jgi:tetratricopeptide (TPR) repeat protein
VALEYAWRRAGNGDTSVFWVHADTSITFTQDYKAIAVELGLPEDLSGEKLLAAVCSKIKECKPWVLVIDNADDLRLFGVNQGSASEHSTNLSSFIPKGPAGTVLWTSRDERISGTLVTTSRAIHVGRMTSEEAYALLETVRDNAAVDEKPEAEELLQELDWIPLAVAQAAAYMHSTRTSLKDYLARLRSTQERWETLKDSKFDRYRREGISNSILDTWEISIEYIRAENEMAYNILHVQAFLDNQDIPFELIQKAAMVCRGDGDDTESYSSDDPTYRKSSLFACFSACLPSRRRRHTERSPELEKQGGISRNDIIKAANRLIDFSFFSLRASEDSSRAYTMHKFVQEAALYRLSREKSKTDEEYFSAAAFRVVRKLFPSERNQQLWGQCERYLSHVQQVSRWAELWHGEEATSMLLLQASYFLYDRGRWKEMEPLDIRAYELAKNSLSKSDPKTLSTLDSLAGTYYTQGRYEESRKTKEEVLTLRREVLGDRHPDTIDSMANLAISYYAAGKYQEAETMEHEVLTLRREVLGDKHPDTIDSMANLAITINARGRYEEAEAIEVEVLALRREFIGDRHPDTLDSMANLAITYHGQERYDEAEKIEEEVLALRREILGDKHPDTIDSMANLASTYNGQGRYDKAEKMEQEVLILQHDVLGDKHPDTVRYMANLASTYKGQGRFEDAQKLEEEVLILRREILGEQHPETIWSMGSLAIALHSLNQHDRAEAMMEECLLLSRLVHGEDSSRTRHFQSKYDSWKSVEQTS